MTSSPHSSSEKDIEVIKQVYTGINRNDIDFVLDLLDASVLRIEPEEFPTPGRYQGHSAMRDHLIKGRSTWAEGGCEPVDFIPAGNKIIAIVHIKVRLKNNTNWIDAHIADGFSIKEGLVTEFHSFINQEKALEWAGTTSDH